MTDDDERNSVAPRAGRYRARSESPGDATRATLLYRALKEDIIRGVLPPRDWLRIDALRERYQAGASPLREALNRLVGGGAGGADRISAVLRWPTSTTSDIDEIMFTRCALNEIMLPAALSRTAIAAWEERVVLAHYHLSKTPPFTSDGDANEDYLARHREFHMSILAPCGSRWLLELSEKLFDWTQRHQNLAMRVGCRRLARRRRRTQRTDQRRARARRAKGDPASQRARDADGPAGPLRAGRCCCRIADRAPVPIRGHVTCVT